MPTKPVCPACGQLVPVKCLYCGKVIPNPRISANPKRSQNHCNPAHRLAAFRRRLMESEKR